MGTQIAIQSVLHGYIIYLHDINQDVLENSKKFISATLRRKKQDNLIENINFLLDLSQVVKESDLIIEAIPENLELKKEVFRKIENFAKPNAIIATNSSSFPISRIEDAVQRKDKVLNIHFYPPISARPMADIMRGTKTSDETFNIGIKWIESIGCTPLIIKKESFGFVFNRIWRAVKKEALKIWAGGHADIETVDKAWRIFTGMPYGPFTMMDGVGLDTVYSVEMSYYKETGKEDDKPPDELKKMVERGELGLKTGKGFYNWGRKK